MNVRTKANFTAKYLFLFTVMLSTSCHSVHDSLKLSRAVPDEFTVVSHKPLEIPSDFSMPAPTPGSKRPQDIEEESRGIIFAAPETDEISPATALLLQHAGASYADAKVRDILDEEERKNNPEQKGMVDKIKTATIEKGDPIVDAEKEKERIEKNKREGKPITEGDTPEIKDKIAFIKKLYFWK